MVDVNALQSQAEKLVQEFLAIEVPIEQMLPMLEIFLPDAEKAMIDKVLRIVKGLKGEAPALVAGIQEIAKIERIIVDAVNS